MKTTITTLGIAAALALGVAGCKKAEKETGPDKPAETHKKKPEDARKAHAGHQGQGHKAHAGHEGHGHAGHKAPAPAARKKPEARPEARKDAPVVFDAPPKVGTKAKCPVMGNVFHVSKETKRSTHKGKHYVFCCPGCKPNFDKNPEKYLSKLVKKG